MAKYYVEFILNTQALSLEAMRDSIVEFGEGLEILHLPQGDDIQGKNFRIRIFTEEPTIIFDTCAQFGKIKSIKIDEK